MPPPTDRHPFPDGAHEALAQWVEETVADNDDALWLVDVLFDLAGQLLDQRDALAGQLQAIGWRIDAVKIRADTALDNTDALQQQVADLTARLAALEPPVFDTTPEV